MKKYKTISSNFLTSVLNSNKTRHFRRRSSSKHCLSIVNAHCVGAPDAQGVVQYQQGQKEHPIGATRQEDHSTFGGKDGQEHH